MHIYALLNLKYSLSEHENSRCKLDNTYIMRGKRATTKSQSGLSFGGNKIQRCIQTSSDQSYEAKCTAQPHGDSDWDLGSKTLLLVSQGPSGPSSLHVFACLSLSVDSSCTWPHMPSCVGQQHPFSSSTLLLSPQQSQTFFFLLKPLTPITLRR
uniref:Uncharacterized protein n=1 Tax=Molossus molossus TaxID=27622 RepID=A0A7J8JVZ2_MOLMO|nr:hypothetical protein HJG59_007943 [Molossus molossus]